MPEVQITRRSHFVPASYLKRWLVDDRHLWVYRLLVSHENVATWRRSTPAGVGFHEYLYTRRNVGQLTDEFEQWLSTQFEAPAEAVVTRVIDGGRISQKDWYTLALFVASQDVRTPARLLESLKRQHEAMPGLVQDVLEEVVAKMKTAHAEGRPLDVPIRIKPSRVPSKVSFQAIEGTDQATMKVEVVVGRETWLTSLEHLLSETALILQRHRWTILRPPPGTQWLTSDNPVVKLNWRTQNDYDLGGGWGRQGTEIFLPLSPHHLLYTRIGEARPPPRGTRIPHTWATVVQRLIVENAHRMVFGSERNVHVATTRPRKVDAAAVAHEAAQWRNWHFQQVAAEDELHG